MNDDTPWGDDFNHEQGYYYDDDGDDYLDMYEDDGYVTYADDDTIDLRPTWRWKYVMLKARARNVWKWIRQDRIHNWRMKHDKRYNDNYWSTHIPF